MSLDSVTLVDHFALLVLHRRQNNKPLHAHSFAPAGHFGAGLVLTGTLTSQLSGGRFPSTEITALCSRDAEKDVESASK